jgi:hypothetical protein
MDRRRRREQDRADEVDDRVGREPTSSTKPGIDATTKHSEPQAKRTLIHQTPDANRRRSEASTVGGASVFTAAHPDRTMP